MAVQQLKTQQNIPDFNLPEKYSSDLWDVLLIITVRQSRQSGVA